MEETLCQILCASGKIGDFLVRTQMLINRCHEGRLSLFVVGHTVLSMLL